MPSINDWAAKAASRILDEAYGRYRPKLTEERVAAIIILHTDPLVRLLRESIRLHDTCDESLCPAAMDDDAKCTCGAEAWNERVREIIDGNE